MRDLNRFKKQKPVFNKSCITSVHITKEQKEFIDRHGLNLSTIVREAIQRLMEPSQDDTL